MTEVRNYLTLYFVDIAKPSSKDFTLFSIDYVKELYQTHLHAAYIIIEKTLICSAPFGLELPEFGSIFLLDFATLIDKMSIFLQKIDSFLRVGRNRVVLVLKKKQRKDIISL